MRAIAGRIPENSNALVSNILKNVTGSHVDSIEHIKGIGMNNSVTVADTSQGKFVVRTNVESHLFRYQREAWCFKELESTPVLTPRVLGCGTINGRSYSVAPFITNSQPIGEGIDQIRIWRILGSYARHLNQIQPPSAEADAYFPMTWEQQVTDDVGLIFKDRLWVEKGFLSPDQQEMARRYLLDCSSVKAERGVSQFDLTIANAVICNSDYDKVYLLDLESANIAPAPFYQLACIAAEKGPESQVTKAFIGGYGFNSDELTKIAPELERFILYRLMRATAWARDRYPGLLGENLERTRPVLVRALSRNFS